MSRLPKPDYARNMRLIGHSDQGGRPDGVQLMVHRGFAYVGHMFSKGFSVIDVRDASNPHAVNYIAAPPNTWNIHLQTHDDLLLVIHAKDMFAAAEFTDERAYYKGALGQKVGTADGRRARDWSAAWRSMTSRSRKDRGKLDFCRCKAAAFIASGTPEGDGLTPLPCSMASQITS